jgi:hypothetical protein
MCGASIGSLKYHETLTKKHPKLVAQFINLDDTPDQNSFTIGGIDGKGGTKVTHLVSYKTPYKIDGQQVLISLGLGDFGVKTLLSYPFLKFIKDSILLESNTLVSGALGEAFKLTIKRPEMPTSAASAPEGIPLAIAAMAPQSVQVLVAMLAQLTAGFKEMALDYRVQPAAEPVFETTRL